MRHVRWFLFVALASASLTGCGTPTSVSPTAMIAPTATATFAPTPAPTLTATPTPIPIGPSVHGLTYRSARAGYYSHPGSDWTLAEIISPMGVNWLRLEFKTGCHQRDIQATEIQCGDNPSVPTEADLGHVVQRAHELGMRVLVDPQIELSDDPYRHVSEIGFTFDESQWQAWFASYTQFVTHFADIAQRVAADAFSIGYGLTSSYAREEDWRSVAAATRQVYGGPILYTANEESVWMGISWWDAVDVIGISPSRVVLAASNHPTVEEMTASWAPVVNELELLSQQWNRPVVVTDIGYASVDGISTEPWNVDHVADLDTQEQAAIYQATFEAFADRDWFDGFFWTGLDALGTFVGPGNVEPSPYGKEAEGVLRQRYGAAPRSEPSTALTINPDLSLGVFGEGLMEGWKAEVSGEGSRIDLQHATPSLGPASIEVVLGPGGEVALTYEGEEDLSTYSWLVFFVDATQTVGWGEDATFAGYRLARFSAALADAQGYPRPLRVQFSHSQYTTGGRLQVNEWRAVRIPIAAFGPGEEPFRTIIIRNDTAFMAPVIHIDSMRLWAGG